MAKATRGGDDAEQGEVFVRMKRAAGGLQIDDADEFAARHHGDGHLTAHGVEADEVSGIDADVGHQQRLARSGDGADDTFAQAEAQVLDELFTMADAVAQAEALLPVIVEEDGEQVMRDGLLDDGGDFAQQAIEVEGLRGDRGDLEQKVEQIGALFEADAFFSNRHSARLLQH